MDSAILTRSHLAIIAPLSMIPGHEELKSMWDVTHKWHAEALDFLHVRAPKILLYAIVAFVLIQLLHVVTRRLTAFSTRPDLRTGMRAQQLRTLASVTNGVGLFVIVFVAAVEALGIGIGTVIASAGVVGLALGFGAQTLVKDVINGFFILIENQYDVGDTVKISGVSGTVEQLTLRRTVLRDADGSLHNIPNSEIKIVSNTTRDWTQTALHFAVSYQEDSDRIIGLLKKVAEEVYHDPEYAPLLVAVPEVPGIERITGSQVDYLMQIKTRPNSQCTVSREIRRRTKACFEKNKIQAAGPTMMYMMKDGSK